MTDLFANVNDGDFVRVEFKDGAMEGMVETVDNGWRRIHNSAALRSVVDLATYATKVTVLRRALPPEPAVGSVVVRTGDWSQAFMRDRTGWRAAHGLAMGWEELHAVGRCSVRVIYTPEEK